MTLVAGASRIVVKVGSSLVTNEGRGIDHDSVARWAGEIAAVVEAGLAIVPSRFAETFGLEPGDELLADDPP